MLALLLVPRDDVRLLLEQSQGWLCREETAIRSGRDRTLSGAEMARATASDFIVEVKMTMIRESSVHCTVGSSRRYRVPSVRCQYRYQYRNNVPSSDWLELRRGGVPEVARGPGVAAAACAWRVGGLHHVFG